MLTLINKISKKSDKKNKYQGYLEMTLQQKGIQRCEQFIVNYLPKKQIS